MKNCIECKYLIIDNPAEFAAGRLSGKLKYFKVTCTNPKKTNNERFIHYNINYEDIHIYGSYCPIYEES